jgi:hypothetical protein
VLETGGEGGRAQYRQRGSCQEDQTAQTVRAGRPGARRSRNSQEAAG